MARSTERRAAPAAEQRVYEALHLDAYGRVDFLMDKADGRLWILPGTPSLIPPDGGGRGMDYAKIIEVSFEEV